ncbi:unnamed protein product [Leptosia nina]|uniref:Uncharacterized protein n=1 Tax=Leptosia nina TaxID=320188 RepID=A0AAV1J8S2_9NEOP
MFALLKFIVLMTSLRMSLFVEQTAGPAEIEELSEESLLEYAFGNNTDPDKIDIALLESERFRDLVNSARRKNKNKYVIGHQALKGGRDYMSMTYAQCDGSDAAIGVLNQISLGRHEAFSQEIPERSRVSSGGVLRSGDADKAHVDVNDMVERMFLIRQNFVGVAKDEMPEYENNPALNEPPELKINFDIFDDKKKGETAILD